MFLLPLLLAACGTNCHKRCRDLMPNLCGVNEKLMAEVLTQVKRDKEQGGTRNGARINRQTSAPENNGCLPHSPQSAVSQASSSLHASRSLSANPNMSSSYRGKRHSLADFNLLKVLGKGSFGKVTIGDYHLNCQLLVVLSLLGLRSGDCGKVLFSISPCLERWMYQLGYILSSFTFNQGNGW